jgi:energy-converting hydrogenase Eha subunit E
MTIVISADMPGSGAALVVVGDAAAVATAGASDPVAAVVPVDSSKVTTTL